MRSPSAIVAATVLATAACTLTIVGNRDLASQSRDLTPFTEVAADDTLEISLTVDPSEAAEEIELTLAGESNLLPLIETQVVGEVFTANLGDNKVEAHYPLKLSATVADIARAEANNVARVELEGVDRETLDLMADNVGHVDASGVVTTLMIDANNAATVAAADLEASSAMVSVNNGAEVTLCVTGEVTGVVNNGGSLTVLCGGDTSELQVRNGGSVN